MVTAQERLAALKTKLKQARNENLKAVEDESKRRPNSYNNRNGSSSDAELSGNEESPPSLKSSNRQRRRVKRERSTAAEIGSADEADGEDEDDGFRSMKRRAKNMKKTMPLSGPGEEDGKLQTVAYGLTGHDPKAENIDRMVNELQEVDRRRSKFHRRRAFDENRTEITFINEGNRLFNKTLDKHFDKFESVQKIKDSLERGTA